MRMHTARPRLTAAVTSTLVQIGRMRVTNRQALAMLREYCCYKFAMYIGTGLECHLLQVR